MTLVINEEATQLLRAFGETQVPMINFCEPVVTQLSNETCTIRLPLNAKTKNHLGSMYFGALNVGADCACGLLAMHLMQQSGQMLSLVFKNSAAEYLKRPEADVYFTCSDGIKAQKCIEEAIQTGQRCNIPMNIVATAPSLFGDEPVARFTLTLSLKCIS